MQEIRADEAMRGQEDPREDDARARLYTRPRKRGGVSYYADFRDFGDFGGGQEALKPEGAREATTDEDAAVELALARLRDLEALAQETVPLESRRARQLHPLALGYLEARANEEGEKQWLETVKLHLERAIWFFGAEAELQKLRRSEIKAYGAWLRSEEHNRGRGFADGTVHQHYCTLGQLYEWAQDEFLLPSGQNPIHAARKKANGRLPAIHYRLTPWFELDEMGELLRWIRDDYRPSRADALPFFYEMTATSALTGARRGEVTHLERGDVDFERGVIRLGNQKTKDARSVGDLRHVPLFGQLEEILRAYLSGPHAPRGRLLFPGHDGGPIDNIGKQRKRVPLPVRFGDPTDPRNLHRDGRTMYFGFTQLRHTYCAARLQTLDHGHPIAKYTVQKEMGHGSEKMIDRVYGHLGTVRNRVEEVRYPLG